MRESRLVYTTNGANNCPTCHQALRKCRCDSATIIATGQQRIKISRETKGRKGRAVTLVSGLQISDKELKLVTKKLKTLCGSGGTCKHGVIEIQGEHRQQIKQFLEQHYKLVI